MNLGERFSDISDAVSAALGHYLFSIISFGLLVAWTAFGFFVIARDIETGGGDPSTWFTSQSWNFPLNTITTVGEWFIGALVAAAANRVERRNREINDREVVLLERLESVADKIEAEQEEELEVLKPRGEG